MTDFIARNTPKIKDSFITRSIPSDNGCDCYKIYSENGKIILAGCNSISLAMAYYRYLSEFCSVEITSGDYDISYIARAPLPDREISFTCRQKIRARTSYRAFTLEGNYTGFDRWQKEIDFMAMRGINRAYQPVGFEGVLYEVLTEIGMKEEFCLEYSSGPSFITRQLTGNLAAINSVNSLEYLKRKISLGKMITQRMKEVGITPILPAALPNVPFSLRKKYIKMDIFVAPIWHNFPPVFLIKPNNTFFEVLNKKFLDAQRRLIGETDSFFFEPLYEAAKKGYNTYMENLGKALGELLGEFEPGSVCYIHSGSVAPAFFSKVTEDRYILIDDAGDRELTSGRKILVPIEGNYYGRTGLYGDVGKVCSCPFAEARSENAETLGTAVEIDTFSGNPLYCSAALNAATADAPFDPDDFTSGYAKRRYTTDAYTESLKKLRKLCYSAEECPGSILCARPCTNVKHTAPFDTMERNYDFKALYGIIREILDTDARKNDAMRADIVSFVTAVLAGLAYPVYLKATESFREKNVSLFEQTSNLFMEICEDADRILRTRRETNFFTDIERAKELGADDEEKQMLEINYLMLRTVMGQPDHSVLYDTVWSESGGLIRDFYAKRWHMYFRTLAAYFDNPKKLRDNSKKQILDRNEYKGSYLMKRFALFENDFIENYIPRSDGIGEEDTIKVATEIMQKYSEVVFQF
ncbi:MAG: alpha-N-acetylglucosaminidase C-terminal domain-containing protein [Clostridia bacterium]|nr:alpha-N-acetylglucosaminidase C-terminal domain-containing protein [Clostridia bacterium]